MVHIGFVMENTAILPEIKIDCTKCFEQLLDNYNLNEGSEISRVLSDFEASVSYRYLELNETVFNIIARKSNNRRSSENGVLQHYYNNFLDKKGLKEGDNIENN